ncbi:MAG: hypothetical protein DI548_10555, partial [Flavobacterium johnsoniae]
VCFKSAGVRFSAGTKFWEKAVVPRKKRKTIAIFESKVVGFIINYFLGFNIPKFSLFRAKKNTASAVFL